MKEELHQNGPEEVPESVETRVIRVGPVGSQCTGTEGSMSAARALGWGSRPGWSGRETGLILRCTGKAGNPFQTTQGPGGLLSMGLHRFRHD